MLVVRCRKDPLRAFSQVLLIVACLLSIMFGLSSHALMHSFQYNLEVLERFDGASRNSGLPEQDACLQTLALAKADIIVARYLALSCWFMGASNAALAASIALLLTLGRRTKRNEGSTEGRGENR